jgi:RNA polymerase sigma-70 factor (ECF subfamily)
VVDRSNPAQGLRVLSTDDDIERDAVDVAIDRHWREMLAEALATRGLDPVGGVVRSREEAGPVSGLELSGGAGAPPAGRERHRTDRDARFESLYREAAERVYALCLRLTGEAELAEELAQEAFVRAWEKLDTFRGEARITTWMHRLTVNVVHNALRRRSRRPVRTVEPDVLEALGAGSRAASHVNRIALERAIAELPERARMVFVLYDIEGYPQEEIAEMMEITVGTVKSQLHRARRLLRGALAS